MDMKEIKYKARRRRERQAAKRKIIFLLATVFMITIGSVIFGNTFLSAHAEETEISYEYYKSIEIESGDSLWSIAEEYKDATESTQEYIDKLMELNDLKTERIHKGQYLIVAYQDTELR